MKSKKNQKMWKKHPTEGREENEIFSFEKIPPLKKT